MLANRPKTGVLRASAYIFLFLFLGLTPKLAAAEDSKANTGEPTNLDHINLAKLMLQDSHFDRALASLQLVDLTQEGVDPKEYWYLLGLANYKLSQWDDAQKAYAKAIELGDLRPRIYLQRASALLQLKKSAEAITVIENMPPGSEQNPDRWILESTARYDQGNKHAAFAAIDEGHAQLPENEIIARKRILLLVDIGLYQTAINEAQVFFERSNVTSKDYAALATALIQAKQAKRAAVLLEQAALLFPTDNDIRKRLALAYMSDEKPLSAGDILYPSALVDPDSARAATELYIKAKHFLRATRMNARVDDQTQKVRQRLAILLEQQHVEAATALYPRIKRLGLLKDDSIAYALAYTFYRTGDFPRMEQLLSLISDSALFQQGVQLRKTAEDCRQSFWKCD